MKLDPGMHIVMHLVFFGKSGVTHFSAEPVAGVAGIWPPAPPAMAKGHIAWPQFFSGTSAQNCNFNSKFNLLILVNSIENSKKNQKMQNQFFWIRCK
jgi:hypothetical protein